MLLHMRSQSCRPQKLLVAVPANVRSLRLVLLFMVLKQVEGGKATVTISKVALERLLAIVNS